MHPITHHADGCACSRCDLTVVGEPSPDEIGYDQQGRPVYTGPPDVYGDRYKVVGPPELCRTCTDPFHNVTHRLSAEERCRLFVEAVEQLAIAYGVVFKHAPAKIANPAFPGMYGVDIQCTVVP